MRSNILSICREMLAELGYEGVTMRDLAKRCGVAVTTLYDAHGSKEQLVVDAVEERALMVFRGLEKARTAAGLDHVFDIMEKQTEAILETPSYARAIAPIVAANPGSFEIGVVFRRLMARAVEEIAEAGDLAEWAEVAVVCQLIQLEAMTMHQAWANGAFSSDDFLDFNILAVCHALGNVTRGTTRDRIQDRHHQIFSRLRKWKV